MAEFVCDTSPLQYLHQVGLLNILPDLTGQILVPPAVVAEIVAGRSQGIDLPELSAHPWITVRLPASRPPRSSSGILGSGELAVLALALECVAAVAILDDRQARLFAQSLGLRLTGTLGLLLDAKRAGSIPAVRPVLDQLRKLGFRLAGPTRDAVLKLAGETS